MTTSAFPPFRAALLLLCLAWGALCIAQRDGKSLTKEFAKLSPKERSRIAERETREAALDSSYQAVMQAADEAFRADRYQDALVGYRKARNLRPYNVYPKVKIDDLQALIERKQQELATPPPETKIAPAPPSAPAASIPPATDSVPGSLIVPSRPPAGVDAEVPSRSPAGDLDAEEPAAPNAGRPASRTSAIQGGRPALEEDSSAQLDERVYMEAGAVVTERIVEDEDRPVTYKKVVHPWGQTFHFKDGIAISVIEWKERFKE